MAEKQPKNDLGTHDGIAKELLSLLEQSNLQIPITRSKDMSEILDWLGSIADGGLVITTVVNEES